MLLVANSMSSSPSPTTIVNPYLRPRHVFQLYLPCSIFLLSFNVSFCLSLDLSGLR